MSTNRQASGVDGFTGIRLPPESNRNRRAWFQPGLSVLNGKGAPLWGAQGPGLYKGAETGRRAVLTMMLWILFPARVDTPARGTEPHRDSRRLQRLTGWSHDEENTPV